MAKASQKKHGSNRTSREMLSDYVERYNRLDEERSAIAEDMKSILAEAKSMGFCGKALKDIAKRARETPSEALARQDHEAMVELYAATLGMLDGTPLGDAARRRTQRPPDPDGEPPAEDSTGGAGAELPETNPDARPVIDAAALAEAREAGSKACTDGARVTENPYVAGDPRRAAWDEGWCTAAGSDGMDIPAALRRPPKAGKKNPSSQKEA